MGTIELKNKIEKSFSLIKKGQIYKSVISDTEKILIEKALDRTKGNRVLAARLLGLNRNTIRTKIRKLDIKMEKYRT